MAIGRLFRQVCRGGAAALLLFVLGCAGPPALHAAAVANPPPAGMARIWIYRAYEPYVSLDRPYVRVNGQVVGVSEPGGAFYRDVPAGVYEITVDSLGRDVNQFTTVAVAPGQQVYLEVQVLRDWDSGSARGYWYHPTFYARLQLPQVAASAIARSPFYGGGTLAPARNSPG
jgi:hypothetical protein